VQQNILKRPGVQTVRKGGIAMTERMRAIIRKIIGAGVRTIWLIVAAGSTAAPQADQQGVVPAAIPQLQLASRDEFTIESKEMMLGRSGQIQLCLSCSKPRGKTAKPDGLAVLYMTLPHSGPGMDLTGPPSIVEKWKSKLAMGGELSKATKVKVVSRVQSLQDASSGVADFSLLVASNGADATATGTLRDLPKLYSQALGIVGARASVPVSNFRSVPLASGLKMETTSRFRIDKAAPVESSSPKPPADAAPNAGAMLLSGDSAPKTAKTHYIEVTGVAFSPDNKVLATWSRDEHLVKVWGMPEGSLLASLHEDSVKGVAFSPDSSLLFTGGYSDAVTVWSFPGPKFKARLTGFARYSAFGGVMHIATSRSGSLLITEGNGKIFDLFSLPNLKWRATLGSNDEYLMGKAITPDGKLLIASRSGGTIQIIELPGGKLVGSLPGQGFHLAVSPDGALVAYVEDGILTVRALPGGQVQSQVRMQGADTLGIRGGVAFSPDGKRLAATNAAKVIEIFAAPGWNAEAALVDDSSTLGAQDLAFSPDGKILATAGDAGLVRLWELDGAKRRWALVDSSVGKK
jgi:WD40 repeat protein